MNYSNNKHLIESFLLGLFSQDMVHVWGFWVVHWAALVALMWHRDQGLEQDKGHYEYRDWFSETSHADPEIINTVQERCQTRDPIQELRLPILSTQSLEFSLHSQPLHLASTSTQTHQTNHSLAPCKPQNPTGNKTTSKQLWKPKNRPQDEDHKIMKITLVWLIRVRKDWILVVLFQMHRDFQWILPWQSKLSLFF